MNFSLIICTYKRPESVCKLLDSVAQQSLHPNEILIIDGSPDNLTERAIAENSYSRLRYYKVTDKDRGLTRQRNYGISRVSEGIEVISFLDDDIVLTPGYFENLMSAYSQFPDAIGVGGYILNEVSWKKKYEATVFSEFQYDGWVRKLGSRNVMRKKLGLLSDQPPGVMPEFSNGLSTGFLPPSGEIYPVEFFMGGVSSFRRKLLEEIKFSIYFEGYGLYEDMDFCLRASRLGQLYVNTGAKLYHYHDSSGRPEFFKYGKMVIRNGWYVWRVKYPAPKMKARIKWHSIAFLLTLVRLGNVLSTRKRREALAESLGRFSGWWSLLIAKPKQEN